MPSNHQIQAHQLTPGSTVIVKGLIGFSRLRSLMGPQEIIKTNQARARSMFKLDPNKPITRLNLHHAEVVYADPANPTIEEMYVAERMYTSSQRPELGVQWSIDNKGSVLPILGETQADGKVVQLKPENGNVPADSNGRPAELANDQEVQVVLNVYATSQNPGVGIQMVVTTGPAKWFSFGIGNQDYLAQRGIVFAQPPVAEQAQVQNQPQNGVAQGYQAAQPGYDASTVVDPTTGLAMPSPVTQAATAPPPAVQAAMAQFAQPQPTPAQAAPAPIAPAQAQASAQQSASGGSAFGGGAVQSQAAPAPIAPAQTQAPAQQPAQSDQGQIAALQAQIAALQAQAQPQPASQPAAGISLPKPSDSPWEQ